ncbi:hypothetical protein H4Q32_026404 [Labeo rohita]|uniref:NTR domain-containing protein n=1 Tax=Labeo rohita TaxID=84645 RepID=A0ABQ8L0Q2_LABRO|nr:hypothetical protein H4Q32_026404 [Labeo rohita]
MDLQQTVDTYDMKVEQVLREGTDEEVEGKVRQFLARPRCREHLGLIKGKSYLIMGKSVDLPNHGGRYISALNLIQLRTKFPCI